MRTTSVTVVTIIAVVVAGAVAGCSSHHSEAGATQSVVSSAPASTHLAMTSTSAGPPTSPPPLGMHAVTVVAGLACPDAGSPGAATSPSPTPLAAAVTINAVVRCETVQRSFPGLGTWTVQVAEVADSGLGTFVADLRAPNASRPSGIMCPDFRILVPWFELVDAAGSAINAAIPTDQCGAPQTAVITALQALAFRVTDAVRLAPSA